MNAGMKSFAASKAVTVVVTLLWAVCPLGLFQGQAQSDRTSIEFVSGQFNISENTRTVTLPLRLVGAWSGSVPMVEYATQDGTAVSGRDYVAQAGRAEVIYGWEQPLEIFVVITLLDDTLVEGEESFSVVLSNPTRGVVL